MPRIVQPDRWLFGATLALCLVGQVMVFSASAVMAREEFGSAYSFILRQVLWLGIGLAGMFALMNLDYRELRHPKVIFTGLCVILLLLVAVFFLDRSHATHRWIRIGPLFSMQPSELAKLIVILYMGWFLESRRAHFRDDLWTAVNDPLRGLLPAMGPVLLIAGLVVMQPDLGTAFEILLVSVGMLFVAGLSLK
ncbi:MAG: FtsW/RodA/SpoVE family cell cycle protein, partial [Candidatus Acidiferrales bacterium]